MGVEEEYLCGTSSGQQGQHCYLSCVSQPLQCMRVHQDSGVRGWRRRSGKIKWDGELELLACS